MKKILIFICGLLIGSTITYIVINNSQNKEDNSKYICTHYSNEFEDVIYIKPSTEIDFHQDEEKYYFNITLHLNDQIDFSDYSNNTVMFASISFDGLVPYSILEAEHKYIQIPLKNGKMPENFQFTVSSEDEAFSGEDLDILNDFLNKTITEMFVSVNLFDPNGIIVHVANVYVKK